MLLLFFWLFYHYLTIRERGTWIGRWVSFSDNAPQTRIPHSAPHLRNTHIPKPATQDLQAESRTATY